MSRLQVLNLAEQIASPVFHVRFPVIQHRLSSMINIVGWHDMVLEIIDKALHI